MKGSGFIRGAAVGGFGAALVMVASTALAGTGVGGVFNLGVSNSVDQKTTLTGNTSSGAQLQVDNTLTNGAGALGAQSSSTNPTAKFVNLGSGPAARFQVASGAPFATNSKVKVANLNADTLDGLDSTAFLPVGGTAVNSNQLDGLDSTSFVQANSGQLIGVAYAEPPNSPTPKVQVGPWQVWFGCPSDLTVGGSVHFDNPGSLGANVFDDFGGSDPNYFQVNSGVGLMLPTTAGGDLYTLFAQTNGVIALVHVATAQRIASNDCHFQVEATVSHY